MKISWNWLNELVDIPWGPEETAEKIMLLGFPLENLQKTGVQATNVISVKILSVTKHPNADRLTVVTVTDGRKERTIVCGASNVAAGQVVPLALPGAKLQGGLSLTVSKIRGVESHGMLCSERELGLSDDHAGIMQLPTSTKLGADIKNVIGKGDAIFDFEVLPNRADALSHIGFAREIAALTGHKLKVALKPWKSVSKKEKCKVRIDAPKGCARYLGKLIHDVKVGPSPQWMAERLQSCGLRTINNIVDITNYVLLEWGHPLHAFDLNKLANREVMVRHARAGEKITALDEKTYLLESTDLVIADAEKPIAIAGVMGGQQTGVDEKTTDIFLESAVFNPVNIRLTSRQLNLKSESSIRFEKGTDSCTAEAASLRAAQLILELASGTPGLSADAWPRKEKTVFITLRPDQFEKVTGHTVAPALIEKVLTRLDLKPRKKGAAWQCQVPPYRRDIQEEVDIIEELTRLVGYDAIPETIPHPSPRDIPPELLVPKTERLVSVLKGLGLNETLTSSFSGTELAEKFGVSKDQMIFLFNPLSQEETILRPLVLLPLLGAVQRNINLQRESVCFFEIGKEYRRLSETENEESQVLAGVIYGNVFSKGWQMPEKEVDYYYIKGLISKMAATLSIPLEFKFGNGKPFLHPHQSFELTLDGIPIGWGGMLHPAIGKELDITYPCAIFEMDLIFLLVKQQKKRFQPLPKYSPVERDIAILVDKDKIWGDILNEIVKAGDEILRNVELFDVFAGESLEPNKKSLAFRIQLRHDDHTLTDAEINAVVDSIKRTLIERCGAQIR
ncbi:MAG: phenylalanine--tRNA ligase subunit beta [Elusimicrobia bacterium]|nr:phenylalanine--tRNA ligase subunit beta [Candidatus Obscuribacterium magneticum]